MGDHCGLIGSMSSSVVSGSHRNRDTEWLLSYAPPPDNQTQVVRTLRKVKPAVSRLASSSWEGLYSAVNVNKDEGVSWAEFKNILRKQLHVLPISASDRDLELVFSAMDKDGSGLGDCAEFVDFFRTGPKRAEDARICEKANLERCRRNIHFGLQSAFGSASNLEKKIWEVLNMNDNGSLSRHDFEVLLRKHLNLSPWVVRNSTLKKLYSDIDADGNGIQLKEFTKFLLANNQERFRGGLHLYQLPDDVPKIDKKRKTYKQKLLEMDRRSNSLPLLHTHSFTNVGRSLPPAYRVR